MKERQKRIMAQQGHTLFSWMKRSDTPGRRSFAATTERQAILLSVVVGIVLFLGVGVSVCLVTYTVVDTAASRELRVQVLELKTALENLTGTVDMDKGTVNTLDHVVSILSHMQTQTQDLRDEVDRLSTAVDNNTRITSEMDPENARLKSEVMSLSSSQSVIASLLVSVVSNLSSESPGRLDCQAFQRLGLPSGVYTMDPQDGQPAFPAFCDMDTEGGPWLVFQRRIDGSVNFTRNWKNYTSGFGDLREFWLGLEKLHRLTSAGMSQLRVDLATWEGKTGHALYSTFRVNGSEDNFRLEVRGYSGTAGDDMYIGNHANGTANGMQFSTYDRNHDRCQSNTSCAQQYKAGWWYNTCHAAHPNGVYGSRGSEGGHYAMWRSFTNNAWASLKFVEMKIK